MSTTNVLQKVDISTLKAGDEVVLSKLPPKYKGPISPIIVRAVYENTVHVLFPNGNCKWVRPDDLYYPSKPQPASPSTQQPILVDLKNITRHLNDTRATVAALEVRNHFSKPENQYQIQPAKEKTPQPTSTQHIEEQPKPFPLDVARKLYKEGSTGKDLAEQWYTREQLTLCKCCGKEL